MPKRRRRDGAPLDDPGTSPLLRRLARSIEEKLSELAESGDLSGLPGEGRPLPDDDGDPADPAWAARHLMRAEKVLPAWAELGRDIERGRERIRRRVSAHQEWLAARAALLGGLPAERILDAASATRAADGGFRAALGLEIDELNGLIERYNRLVPSTGLQRAYVDRRRTMGPAHS